MSDVDRLESELKMAKLAEKLEEARDAMHKNRNDKTIAAYKKASEAMVEQRAAHRENFAVVTGPGDAAPKVDTVKSKAGEVKPR